MNPRIARVRKLMVSLMDHVLNSETRRKLGEALAATYFASFPAGYLDTEDGQFDLRMHVTGRYEECLEFFVPWLQRSCDLAGKKVLEIGCGTGSATAALAPLVGHIVAYDIDQPSVLAARSRLELLGLSNAEVHRVDPDRLLDAVEARCTDGVDVCLLYAVLEHQTLGERLATLSKAWSLLRPGGLLVVNETPNRLLPEDGHTSLLPFFNMLPDELALAVAARSPRRMFREAFSGMPASQQTLLQLARWGRGVGYHEFEIAIGDLQGLCVADGYQLEMLRYRVLRPEEIALRDYIQRSGQQVPAAFLRTYLDLILRKPGDARGAPALRDPRAPAALRLHAVERKSDGALVLLSPSSSIEFPVEQPADRLLLAARKHPWSGALRVLDQDKRLLRREVLTSADTAPVYLEVPIPADVKTIRLEAELTPGAKGAEAWLTHIALR